MRAPASSPAGWSRFRATVALLTLGTAGLAVGVLSLNDSYIDFGDGNYLYVAWRLTEGAALYSEILSPQPPIHSLLAAGLVWLGDRLGSAILTVRTALVFVHLFTGWLLYRLARRWGFGRGTAVLGVLVWALCPINFRWSLGWQSENIELIFLLCAQIMLCRRGGLTLFLAGLCGAAALLCNMTAAPYVLFNALFAVVAFRRRGLLCAAGLLGGWLAVALSFEIATGAFFQNTILNQVGSYPEQGLLTYAARKILQEGRSVLRVEGVWVGLALGGMVLAGARARARWSDPVALYRGIYSLGGLLSITYVSKGGTVDYIFCLGDPYVGMWAGYALVSLSERAAAAPSLATPDRRRWIWGTAVFLLLLTGTVQSIPYHWRYLSQQGSEWPSDRMRLVTARIEEHTRPGDLILAPPHFAFITRRRLVEDFSETYLWYIKWLNEMRAGEPGEGVAMMERIGTAIREGRVALIALNGLSPELERQSMAAGTLPEEAQGLENRYIASIDPIRRAVFAACRRAGPRLSSNLPHSASRVFGDASGRPLVYMQEELTFWTPRHQGESGLD